MLIFLVRESSYIEHVSFIKANKGVKIKSQNKNCRITNIFKKFVILNHRKHQIYSFTRNVTKTVKVKIKISSICKNVPPKFFIYRICFPSRLLLC